MTTLPAAAGFAKWAVTYDSALNPLLALEDRIVRPQLGFAAGQRVLDLATGSGRWLAVALEAGADAFGVDASREMLAVAASKRGANGRAAVGDLRCLPFAADSFDVAVCSFALSYVADVFQTFSEFSRVARRIVVSDLHPEACRAGWKRSFVSDGDSFEIVRFDREKETVLAAAHSADLRLTRSVDALFGEPERSLFRTARREAAFETVRWTPAVWVAEWRRE